MKHLMILALLSYCFAANAQKIPLSTKHDSALYYYQLGWEKVLNEGNYRASEIAYRKMAAFDPDFLVGLSLLGRISKDSLEQRKLFNKIMDEKHKVSGDERKLLDVFIELHRLRLVRKEDPEQAPSQLSHALHLAKENLGQIARKYSDEPYYQAEFIESINYLEGAEIALDSLEDLKQDPLMPFLQGYKAHLLASTGKWEQAFVISDELFLRFSSGTVPKPFMVKADLYASKGRVNLAVSFARKVLEMDPENVDAKRLLTKLAKGKK